MDLQELPEFAAVGAFVNWTANIAGFDIAERVPGARVSADFFRVAGRTAAMGRTINSDDVRADARVVVLSDALWRLRFGADPNIVGKTVQVNGEGHEVVGVMPDDFIFPAGARIWTPLALSPAAAADRSDADLVRARPACARYFAGAAERCRDDPRRPHRRELSSHTHRMDAAGGAGRGVLRSRTASLHDRTALGGTVPAAHRVRQCRQSAARARDGTAA